MDKLPLEVLEMILAGVEDHHRGIEDHHRYSSSVQTRQDQLCILARTASFLHAAVLPSLYRVFRQADIRKKWLYTSLTQNPELGSIVRTVNWEQGHGNIGDQLSDMLPSVRHERDKFRMVMARNLIFLHLALSILSHCTAVTELNVELKLQHSDEQDEMLPRYEDLVKLPCTTVLRQFRLFGYCGPEYTEQTASLLAWIGCMTDLETLSVEGIAHLHDLSDFIFLNGAPTFSNLRKLSLEAADATRGSCSTLIVAEEFLRRSTVHISDLCLSLKDSVEENTGFKYLENACKDIANPKSIKRLQLTVDLAYIESNARACATEAWSGFLTKYPSLSILHLIVPEWLDPPIQPEEYAIMRLWSSLYTQLNQVPHLQNTLRRLTFEQQYIDLPTSFIQKNILPCLSHFPQLENLTIIACGDIPNSHITDTEDDHVAAFTAFYRKYLKNVPASVQTTIQARFFTRYEIKRMPDGRLKQRTPYPHWVVDDLGWEDA